NLLVMFIDFGFKTTIIQMLASKSSIGQIEVFSNVFLSRLFVIIIVFVIFIFGDKLLGYFDLSKSIVSYSIYIPIMVAAQSLDELCMSGLQGCHAYHFSAIVWALRSILRLVLTFIFLHFFKLDILGLVYSYIISFGISAVIQYLLIPIRKKFIFSFKIMKEILTFSIPIQLGRFFWFASSRMSTLLLAMFVGPVQVAYYGVAERIPKAFQNLYAAFISVFFPNMSTLFAEKKYEKATATMNQSLRLFSFLMAFSALVIILFGKQIVILLFTSEYAESAPVFSLLMVALHMGLLVQIMGYTLTSAGYPTRSLVENIFRATSVVLLSFLLIPRFGIIGAAMAILFANYMSNPLAIWLLRRIDIHVNNRKYMLQTLTLWACAITFYFLKLDKIYFKILLLFVYILINILFATISVNDIKLIIPEKIIKRVRQALRFKKRLPETN
ncbi:hypothetical protein B6D60_12140, partial [candidate division KSB1 bacterium 4484_87]